MEGPAGTIRPALQAGSCRLTIRVEGSISATVPALVEQNKTTDEMLKDIDKDDKTEKMPETRNEKIKGDTATLEVTPKQSEVVAVASEMGKLSLSLRSLAVAEEKSPADSADGGERGTFTLDSEVSQLLTTKGNSGAGGVTILRGNSKSG